MAYNKVNKLKFILKVQTTYLQYNREGITDIFIYNNYIKDHFHISYKTFWNYLNTNAKQELKSLGHAYGNNDQ